MVHIHLRLQSIDLFGRHRLRIRLSNYIPIAALDGLTVRVASKSLVLKPQKYVESLKSNKARYE